MKHESSPSPQYDKLLELLARFTPAQREQAAAAILRDFQQYGTPDTPSQKTLGEYFFEICRGPQGPDFEPEFPRVQISPRDVETLMFLLDTNAAVVRGLTLVTRMKSISGCLTYHS